MFPKSIRWRIQAWHGVLLLCLVAALVFGFYNYERHSRFREIDSRLHETISPLLPRLAPFRPGRERDREGGRHPRRREPMDGPPDDLPGPDPQQAERGGFAQPESAGFYYIVWDENGNRIDASPNAPANVPVAAPAQAGHEPLLRTRGEFRELIHFVPNGRRVLLGTSTAKASKELDRLAWLLAAAGMGVMIIGLGGGWWLAGRALGPISKISAAAEKISKGNLGERIEISENESELGRLSQTLNQTFERLEKSFEQQARFTADASHELRTPIAVMLTQLQLARSRDRSAEDYRQTLQTCERAVERMRTLVNQMLELARMDIGDQTLMLDNCDLANVAREALEFIEPLALKKQAKLSHNLQSVRIKADIMKLGQVLTNLLNNSLVHNTEGVEVCLSVESRNEHAIIRVADNGIGIPEEAIPSLFERFYRVDKSRSRQKGSSGLGLAICKSIINGHHGTISAESAPGSGAIFTIELPLKLNPRNLTLS